MDRDRIFRKFRAVGRAALTVNLENSHSGNISQKCFDDDGREVIAITATGSQKGELTPHKICYTTIDRTNFGYYKSSSETDIHAAILQIPGVNATVHGHTKLTNIVTMEDTPVPRENPRKPLLPSDPLGCRYLGEAPVDWYAVGSGSKEMTQTLRRRLETAPVAIVQSHGAFARGASLEEALFNLCVIEHSGEILLNAGMLGADLDAARRATEELSEWLRRSYPDFSAEADDRVDFADEPDTVEMFLSTGRRIFESRYSPFHSGSMSIRGANTVMYLPKASMPDELPGPMLELELEPGEYGGLPAGVSKAGLDTHRIIYKNTPLKSVMHCHVAEAQAAAIAAMQESGGARSRVIPIDVEGGFLYPSIPVLPPDPDPQLLCRTLLDYHVAIVAWGGVWAAGEQSLSEALHHVSSVKDICMYRILAKMRGLDIAAMEPGRSKSW